MAIEKDTLDQLLDGSDPKDFWTAVTRQSFSTKTGFSTGAALRARGLPRSDLGGDGSGERHDTSGFALTAGEAQRRPATNASSQLIEYIGLPTSPERKAQAGGQNPRPLPNDEAATRLIYLILRQTVAEWKMSPREWGEAKTAAAGELL
jgi:hypothetical protein